MHRDNLNSRFWNVTLIVTSLLVAFFIMRSALATGQAQQVSSQADPFRGRVVSASGRPVAGATVHLVPVSAMDLTSRMTASSIYAAPYPAEAYDEPLEDAIRLRGKEFPQATTDAQGNFVVPKVPDGQFFIHVTPGASDTEHLPGGDQSRRSSPAVAVARTFDDDRAFEQPFCGCPLRRQFQLSDVPQKRGALADDGTQTGMDGARRRQEKCRTFPGIRTTSKPSSISLR